MARRERSGEAGGSEVLASKAVEATSTRRPSDEEQAQIHKAVRRWASQPRTVTVAAERDAAGRLDVSPPHDDLAGFAVRLSEAVGSGSAAFALRQLDGLARMFAGSGGNPERALNSVLAAVEAVRPENEIEGMLAIQMAATHEAAMACLGRTQRAESVAVIEASGKLANQLMRTYAAQYETLAKSRRGGEQKVRVEHVHVYQGGQAIVGHVEAKGGGGLLENGHQAHALTGPTAYALSPDTSLLRDDPAGADVHGAGRKGQEPVQDARRSERKRRA